MTYLRLALTPQLLLLLFTDLLVDLGALTGLVAVRTGRQRGVCAAALLVNRDVFLLILALLLAGELVLDGALVLWGGVSVVSSHCDDVAGKGGICSRRKSEWNGRRHTRVVGLVRVLLALMEPVLLLLLLDLAVRDGALLVRLVDTRVTDV
jgi:hypothetical protein